MQQRAGSRPVQRRVGQPVFAEYRSQMTTDYTDAQLERAFIEVEGHLLELHARWRAVSEAPDAAGVPPCRLKLNEAARPPGQ